MILARLNSSEFNPYYEGYINNATNEDILEGLKQNLIKCVEFYSNIQNDKHDYAYAEGKWSSKEILQHIIDTERVFAYRALRFSRNDTINLLGFDQDDFNRACNANSRSKQELIEDFNATRVATIALFASFNKKMLERIGMASGSNMSARATGFIIVGHTRHHLDVLQERYL